MKPSPRDTHSAYVYVPDMQKQGTQGTEQTSGKSDPSSQSEEESKDLGSGPSPAPHTLTKSKSPTEAFHDLKNVGLEQTCTSRGPRCSEDLNQAKPQFLHLFIPEIAFETKM